MQLILAQLFILMTLWLLMHFMMFKNKMSANSMTPFECGFGSFFSKLPLSIQFTLLVFMFLLFDIELSILIASNWKIKDSNKTWITTMIVFYIGMGLAVTYEMSQMSWKWYPQ